jgi:GTP1/Obg family GTP-binding protein
MQTIKKHSGEKKIEPYPFIKKEVEVGSCKEKVQRANEILSKTVFLKKESEAR